MSAWIAVVGVFLGLRALRYVGPLRGRVTEIGRVRPSSCRDSAWLRRYVGSDPDRELSRKRTTRDEGRRECLSPSKRVEVSKDVTNVTTSNLDSYVPVADESRLRLWRNGYVTTRNGVVGIVHVVSSP